MSFQPVKALIFDLDGTLIDSLPAHKATARRIAAKYGATISDEDFNKINGLNTRDGFRILAEEKGITINPFALAYEKWKARSDLLDAITIYPQTIMCLSRFDAYPKALATSSPRGYTRANLKRFGIARAFRTIICANDVKNTKPAPDLFLKAAKRLNIPPFQCAVIEDAPNGIRAAKAAGMRSVAVLTTTSRDLFIGDAVPDAFIDDLDGLTPELLASLGKKTTGTKP